MALFLVETSNNQKYVCVRRVSLLLNKNNLLYWEDYSPCFHQSYHNSSTSRWTSVNITKWTFNDYNVHHISHWLFQTFSLVITHFCALVLQDIWCTKVLFYLEMPITPQAKRGPAFPVFRLSSLPPFPKSSSLAWTWKLSHKFTI